MPFACCPTRRSTRSRGSHGHRAGCLATAEKENYFAAIEPGEGRDLYGIGVPKWQPAVDVPTAPGLGFDPDPAFLRRYDCAKQ